MSSMPANDPADALLDAVMPIMEAAFDPLYGEAWTRRQVGDALTFPGTRCMLADASGGEPRDMRDAVGFALTRSVADEEELLLIAVLPPWRARGIGQALLGRLEQTARQRGITRMFLEMRDNNPAEGLYRRNGYEPVGRRREYYRRGTGRPRDAVTFAKVLSASNN